MRNIVTDCSCRIVTRSKKPNVMFLWNKNRSIQKKANMDMTEISNNIRNSLLSTATGGNGGSVRSYAANHLTWAWLLTGWQREIRPRGIKRNFFIVISYLLWLVIWILKFMMRNTHKFLIKTWHNGANILAAPWIKGIPAASLRIIFLNIANKKDTLVRGVMKEPGKYSGSQ